jgi:hypothetical protein
MKESITNPGLFFTIVNNSKHPVKGFAVGDKVNLLSIGSAVFMRAIFQGNMDPGEKRMGMAGAGDDGKGIILFVPPVGVPTQAVQVIVKPNEVVSIPESFVSIADETGKDQFKIK